MKKTYIQPPKAYIQRTIDEYFTQSKETPNDASSNGGAGKHPLTGTLERTSVNNVSGRKNARSDKQDEKGGSSARDAITGTRPGRATNDEPSPVESPNKKARMSSYKHRIRSSGTAIQQIGDILVLPDVLNGAVTNGGRKKVSLKCLVTENLRGRNRANKELRESYRFIYLADFTGYINIGMYPTKTGLIEYDVPNPVCVPTTRCSFFAHVQGLVSWAPQDNKPTTPVFFLSRGFVRKVNVFGWHGESRLMFPTSDVCLQLLNSEYAYCAKFSTTGFCGRVDGRITNGDGDVVLSLHDPVGCIVVKLVMDKIGETAKSFMETKMITKGQFIFIRGLFDMRIFSESNAGLEGKRSRARVIVVQKDDYDKYLRLLMRKEKEAFPGIAPHEM